MREHLPALLFVVPFLTAVAMPMIGLRSRSACRPIVIAVAVVMNLISLLLYVEVVTTGPIHYSMSGWPPPIGIEWVADGLSGIILVALSLIALFTLLYASPAASEQMGRRIVPWHTLILLMLSGLTGIVLAGDLFNLFVFLEITSLSSYALIGIGSGRAAVAAFRYLIIGTIGGWLYLLGVGFFYAATGTLNISDLAHQLPSLLHNKAVVAGLIFVIIGLAIKTALLPLHGWLPDAYENAPDAVTPLIAALVTKVTLYAVIRIIFWVLGVDMVIGALPVLSFLMWVGILATVAGAFLAFSQVDIKRMFAYAGISHVGLVLIGVSTGNATGFAGGVFYLVNEMVMQALLFIIAGAAFYRDGVRTIDDVARLRGQMPWTLAGLIIVALSMVGIPPTGGFFGKLYILLGALEAQQYVAVVVIIGVSVLTLAYFLKVIEPFVVGDVTRPEPRTVEVSFLLRLSLGVLSACILALGMGSDLIMTMLYETSMPVRL